MEKLKSVIRGKLRSFLGLNELELRVETVSSRYKRMESTWEKATAEIQDLSLKGNTRIVIASNIGQGFCHFYDLRFDNYRDVIEFSKNIESMQVRSQTPYIDAPYGYMDTIDGMRRDMRMNPRKRK